MVLKPCPVCGCKPLLLSEEDVMCVNRECPVKGVVTKKKVWNVRAEVVSRDRQILQELKLEHIMENNLEKLRLLFPDDSW